MVYMQETFVPADFVKGLSYMEKAAAKGMAEAQYFVGGAYYRGGLGIEKDEALARQWLELAAAQGHENARNFLAQWPSAQ